jgi:hypothetical protein
MRRRTFVLALIIILLVIGASRFLSFNPSIPSASAVETAGNIGVYSDRRCTQNVYSISWGTLTPGQTKQVTAYVRNEGNETLIPYLTTQNWQPQNASLWLNFAWTCQNTTIEVGQAVKVTQTLYVPSNLPAGFSSFSFEILFQGLNHLIGDINKDGTVNMKDLAIIAAAYNSTPQDPQWNPQADLNQDGIINMRDIAILVIDYGQTTTT